jgi:GNAT superfamily N-acetyltransferase
VNGCKIERLKGKQVHNYIDDLAKLRIQIFKEYPYLYEGNLSYEIDYLNTYTACDESILIVASMKSKIIGVSTAIPLEYEMAECQKPFLDTHLPISKIFYLGESVLLPEYRGQGIYRQFFDQREKAAMEYGSLITTFCAVSREADDPRSPKGYEPLDNIWQHFGYQKHPELCAYYKWQEIGDTVQTSKPMIFWMKYL